MNTNNPEPLTGARMRLNLAASKNPNLQILADLLSGIPLVPETSNENQNPTAMTNMISIYYNVPFINSLSPGDQEFVLLHEALHIFREDGFRGKRSGYPGEIYNQAADLLINNNIQNQHAYTPPSCVLTDPNNLYDLTNPNTTTELVCKKLMQKRRKEEEEEGEEEGEIGTESDEPGNKKTKGKVIYKDLGGFREPTKEELKERGVNSMEELQADIRERINTAVEKASLRGHAPGSMIESILKAQVPKRDLWTSIRELTFKTLHNESSHLRLNKRKLAQRIVSPTLYNRGIGPVVIALDTSGSMGQTELQRAQGGLNSLIEEFSPSEVTVIYCDTKIQRHPITYEQNESIKLERVGGGGTSFVPVFEYIRSAYADDIDLLIYFTDLEGDFPNYIPSFTTVWVDTSNYSSHFHSNFIPPFGTKVKFE